MTVIRCTADISDEERLIMGDLDYACGWLGCKMSAGHHEEVALAAAYVVAHAIDDSCKVDSATYTNDGVYICLLVSDDNNATWTPWGNEAHEGADGVTSLVASWSWLQGMAK